MANNNEQMAPNASSTMSSKRLGVRRVNNRPIYILFGIVGAFLAIMAMVAGDRSAKQKVTANGPSEKTGNTYMYAKEIAGDHTIGMIQPVPLVVPTPPAEEVTQQAAPSAKPADLSTPPILQMHTDNLPQPQFDEDAQRIHMMKLQMLEEAIKAKTGVQTAIQNRNAALDGTPHTRQEMIVRLEQLQQEASAIKSDDPTAAYKARLAQIKSMGIGSQAIGSDTSPMLLNTSSGGNSSYAQFDNKGNDRWQLNSKLETPHSPFELRAGFIIPAILISGINSDLPGQIMGQVSQNVYDTATGKYLLIPQGSRLVGSYSSDVSYGQARILVAWQRIVFPDGKAIDIGSMPGADSAGYSGFRDRVNNHYFRTFASAILMSGIMANISYTQNKNNNGGSLHYQNPTMNSEMSQALAQQIGKVAAQLITKNLNTAPTLEIRPGYRFNIIVTKDMAFSKPYQPFDY